MKRAALLVTLVSLVGTACKKESPTTLPKDANAETAADPWSQPEAKKDPIKRPFFWSAEKDGKTTYLLGTMHMGVDAEARLPKIIWDKLDAAPTFAMEADPSEPALATFGQRKAGTLSEELGPEYWKKLEAALAPVDARTFDGMKPIVLASVLSLKHLPKTPAMDGVLLGRAINQNKQVVYLESGAAEMAIIEKHMDARMLKMLLDTIDKAPAQAQQMLDAYLAGDEEGMVALSDSQRAESLAYGFTEAEYDASMHDLLYRRNDNWIAPIEKLHAGGGGFIAVGALHLVGKRSVLESLAAKGFKITRITP